VAVAGRLLVVNVAELLRRPGSRKDVSVRPVVGGLQVADAVVPEGTEVDVDVELESLSDGIVVTGRVAADWQAQCRRCLGPVTGRADVAVRELYQSPPLRDEDAFEMRGEQVDLEPLVREAIVLELPLAPVCQPECRGLCPVCGANRNETDCGHDTRPSDPRWAALEDLRERLDLDDAGG
jgi:uncharacterized protein